MLSFLSLFSRKSIALISCLKSKNPIGSSLSADPMTINIKNKYTNTVAELNTKPPTNYGNII